MGFLDDAKKKLSQAVDKHGDKIDQGITKATQAAQDLDRKRTGGKHGDKIVKGAAKARESLDKLDGKPKDDLGGGTPGAPR
ncbi:antitoxin [Nocardioides aequoreus]|uniref:antitoxin n=1 Tax=Nocardioides aequoreus TaxID=397278 RepID=UPI0004C2F043|nr:antitoxin [Nocardioides aequoreus]